MQRFCSVLFGLLIAFVGFATPTKAQMSDETLEKEQLARYYINYAGYLIEVGKYFEALESYDAAEEITTLRKTKIDALLAKATLLSSFLDAAEEALGVYRYVRGHYDEAAEIGHYREGLLLFDMQQFHEARENLEDYLHAYPQGRFRFQAEALVREIAKMPALVRKVPSSPAIPAPASPPVVEGKHPEVRVRMCQSGKETRIEGDKVCLAGRGCKDRFILGQQDGKFLVDGSPAGENVLVFESEKPLRIVCGSRRKRVRGKLTAQIREGKLLVINLVDIEDYLLSVVPSENPASWPVESLKAQAVAARTYAYYQLLHRKDWAYDLVDNAGDQAYEGMDKEHPRSADAVKATGGQILTYEEKPILAMFSANSGGHTADSQAIFNLYKPYLVAHRDPASLNGQMANWSRKYAVSDIVEALGKINIKAQGLERIEAEERGSCGRVLKVRLVLKGGETKILRNRTTLRRALDLPEILHGIRREADTFIFEGRGWGHGVGYSQWGSADMGKEKNYKEILSFYYGGVRLEKRW